VQTVEGLGPRLESQLETYGLTGPSASSCAFVFCGFPFSPGFCEQEGTQQKVQAGTVAACARHNRAELCCALAGANLTER
jgi:hypothetical protein